MCIFVLCMFSFTKATYSMFCMFNKYILLTVITLLLRLSVCSLSSFYLNSVKSGYDGYRHWIGIIGCTVSLHCCVPLYPLILHSWCVKLLQKFAVYVTWFLNCWQLQNTDRKACEPRQQQVWFWNYGIYNCFVKLSVWCFLSILSTCQSGILWLPLTQLLTYEL